MYIACCKCGTTILPNSMNMCNPCSTSEIDITSNLNTNRIVEHCRQCDRYHIPPRKWITCAWHSRELLAFLLKTNTQLLKYKIIDSEFVYTEEHSKQLEHVVILEKDKIRKQVNIKYRIRNKQCTDCQKIEAKLYWTSLVQVRQRVMHKKTLLYLEQLILHAKTFKDTSNIKERRDGIDFYYTSKTPALKMVEFIKKTTMVRLKVSEQLITEDKKSNKAKYKFTYCLEIVPICRDDVLKVSERVARKYGIGLINIVLKVNSCIKMIDPISMKIVEVDNRNYWGYKDEFRVLMSSKNLRKYTVCEVEKTGLDNGKYAQSDVYVMTDVNQYKHCKSHLGNLLKENGTVLGYDFEHSPLSDEVKGEYDFYLIRREKVKNRAKKSIKNKQNISYEEMSNLNTTLEKKMDMMDI